MSRFRPILSEFGLTEQQWRILRALSETGPLEPGQIAQTCCVLSPSLTGILSRMEAQDLVTRSQSAADQRRQSVALTARSEAMVKRMTPLIAAQYRALESQWGAETVAQLYATLDDVLARNNGASKSRSKPMQATAARATRAHPARRAPFSNHRRAAKPE